jgi:hypothetical protein
LRQDDTAAGFVALEDSAVERSAVGGFCLEIVTRERRHFFRANDREDMEVRRRRTCVVPPLHRFSHLFPHP